jgi:hypothetical protein
MTSQNSFTAQPHQRIYRAEQIQGKGAYWDTCRRDDADPQMFGPLSMPYAVPGEMLDAGAGEKAWTYWYGALKQARKASERAARRLTTLEASYCPSLISVPHFERLSRRVDLDLFAVATDHDGSFRLHGQELMPLVYLMPVLEKAIGAETCLKIYELAMTAPAQELCQVVEAAFPFMKALHGYGVLVRSTSQHLLGLHQLIQTLELAKKASAPDLGGLRLLASCLIRTLPTRIGILATISSPALSECFDWPCRFYGVSSADLAAGGDIWSMVPESALADTAISLTDYHFPLYSDEDFNNLVAMLDRHTLNAIAGKPVALEINAVYQDFLGAFALAQHADLQQFLQVGGVFFAAEPYIVPADMIRPGFSLVIEGHEAKVANALFNVMIACYCAGNVLAMVEQVAKAHKHLDSVGEKIKAMSQNSSPKKVAKIQALGKKTNEELDQGRVWFVDEAMRLKPLIAAWAAFYEELATLR